MRSPDIHFLVFYTEGRNKDNGVDLTEEKDVYINYVQKYFKNIHIFYPQKLIKNNSKWGRVFESQLSYMQNKCSENERPFIWNKVWAELNFLLWKPELILDNLCNNPAIKNGDLIFYHDLNIKKYKEYLKGLDKLDNYLKKNLKNKSILLFADTIAPLSQDTKQELLTRYLSINGENLIHLWGGCLAMKKDEKSIKFIKTWLSLTRIRGNRDQFTSFPNFKNFYWHSVDQSTLSVAYYVFQAKNKSKEIKLVNLFNSRVIPPTRKLNNFIKILKNLKYDFLFFKNKLFFLFYRRSIKNINTKLKK